MIRYTFAKVMVMGMPNLLDVNNPFVIGRDVKHIINVSENTYSLEVGQALADRGICTYHFPLSEDYGADWRGNLLEALATLKAIVGRDERVVVHCGFGNNRSRTVVEALYYLLTGEMYQDEYKGFENHLLYNVSQGHFEVGDLDGLVM